MKISHAFAVFAAAACLVGKATAAEPDSATTPTAANVAKTTET